MRFNIAAGRFEEEQLGEDKLAVAGSDRDLGWGDLRAEVMAMVAMIKDLGLPKGDPVLIRGHKEAGMVVSMMACMYLDHPYVPLDVMIPDDRVRKIQVATGARLAIQWGADDFPAKVPHLVSNGRLQHDPSVDVVPMMTGRVQDPVRYIIFTSGSTGEPKGVCITREAAASFLEWMTSSFNFSAEDVFVNQAPFSFDLSVYELFTCLHLGATLLLNDAATAKDAAAFLQRMARYHGSVWVSTPTFAYIYLTEPTFLQATCTSLHTFLFCGEALPKKTAERLLDRFPTARVLNTYGPTEATVATTLVNVDRDVLTRYADMPLGFPKPGTIVRTVGAKGEASKEEPGEIEIIGPNVSIGYLNNAGLNAEKFFVEHGTRGFRTGDFGWFKDGMLFFTGRKDEQVKLNGFRIELGDITAQLLAVPGVADAIAVPLRNRGEVRRIVGFVRPRPGVEAESLKPLLDEHLARELPAYMVPGDILFVNAFPVNNNHKTDRQALIELYLGRKA